MDTVEHGHYFIIFRLSCNPACVSHRAWEEKKPRISLTVHTTRYSLPALRLLYGSHMLDQMLQLVYKVICGAHETRLRSVVDHLWYNIDRV